MFGGIHRTREEVLGQIDAFLTDSRTALGWDEFLCVPIRGDAELESIRQQINALPALFPIAKYQQGFCNDHGLEQIQAIAEQLSQHQREIGDIPASTR